MAAESELDPLFDPTSSTLAFFGAELRLRREAAGISQSELAKVVHCAPSLLSKIESAKRVPKDDLAVLLDSALGTDGFFERLWPVMIKNAYPAWFRPYVELEEAAAEIWSFEVQVVPGLLQTESYAGALFAPARLPNAEDLVAARMTRQHILERDNPPKLWAVLDENVLRRAVGGPLIMAQQLQRLVESAQHPHVVVQVVPYDVGAHASMDGPFAGLTLDEGPDVVYVDGRIRGLILADPADVKEHRYAYDLIRADALSPSASIDLIASVAKELNP
ncbi:helix-turn-helix domain-containing protein [Streptomyces sp. 8N706]|uniref:helix-turn-helix domain-containing protein n=1 Tax=Streptomyces sp. 8N706 TaxID=3457416 RepID=UPI003FD0FEC5